MGPVFPASGQARLPVSRNPGIAASATRHTSVLVSAYATEVLTAAARTE
jgi:hypothetical protein